MEEKRESDFRSRRRNQDRRPRPQMDSNIKGMIAKIEENLIDAIKPEPVNGLNSFERKLVHRHFDHNKSFETRTYRNGENFTLFIYPIANLEKFAMEKAEESLASGDVISLPPMGSYERFIVHNKLKTIDGIETASEGEGSERHIKISSKSFGRSFKKIVKKIRLF